MASDDRFTIACAVDLPSALRVLSFRGCEQISRTYRFEVRVVADPDDEGLGALLLKNRVSLLVYSAPGAARAIHGVVSRVELGEPLPGGRRAYGLTIVPRFQLLKRGEGNRIFQDMSVFDIASAVLAESRVNARLDVTGTYPTRAYCVQYQESDHAFLSRLFAEEGLFYWFDHPIDADGGVGAEVMVIGDTAKLHPPVDGAAEFSISHDSGMHAGEDQIAGFELSRRVRALGALTRGYDFQRPQLELRDTRLTPDVAERLSEGGDPREVRALSPGEEARLAATGARSETIYRHDGAFEESPAEPTPALVVLEEERARVVRGSGYSWSARLIPRRRFTLHEHLLQAMNRSWVVTATHHEGWAPDLVPAGKTVYQNRFECVPSDVRFRPQRPRRRLKQVTETATVVGPAGEEVHTDEHGRIKVQFHWDLDGKRNERSSCWMRTAQAWAGSGWGSQFIPRVGMEVLVTFLGGDVDRPVVIGCLYNATHPPPYLPPQRITQSGFRTQSLPGGEGYNELLFDDAKNAEVVSIRAQKNMVAKVMNDHRTEVGGKDDLMVAGDRTATVQGEDALEVQGGQTIRVHGPSMTSVGGGSLASVAGDRQANVAGDDSTRVAGGTTVMVAEYHRTLIGQGKEPAHGLVTATGNYRIGAAGEIIFSGAKRLTLACGETSIELSPTEIKLTAPILTLAATRELACAGKDNTMSLGESIEIKGNEIKLFSKKGSLVMDEDAKIDANYVKLNCDPSRPKPKDKSAAPPRKGIITFRVDPHLESDQPFTLVIQTPTGELIEKQTDEKREVKIEGLEGDHYTLVDVRQGDQSLSKKPG